MRALFTAGVLFLLFGLCFAKQTETEVGTQQFTINDAFHFIKQNFSARLPPHTGTQFAVLALIPDALMTIDDLADLLKPGNGNIYYNFYRPIPKYGIHAEVRALNGRNNLINAYQMSGYAGKKYTPVLYTWIHPCANCADVIIHSAGDFTPPLKYVGYTTQGTYLHPPLDYNQRAHIKNRLKNNGIRLIKVK